MEKTLNNVKLLVATIIQDKSFSSEFSLEVFAVAYTKEEPFPDSDEYKEVETLTEQALWNEFARYSPDPLQDWKDTAEKIIVTIAGKEYRTYLDHHGTQRFYGSPVMQTLIGSLTTKSEVIMNSLLMDYQLGNFSSEDWLDFMTSAHDYSVSSLMSLDEFSYLPIENPLLEDKK